MVPQRLAHKSFPVDAFVRQYNAACHTAIQESQVQVLALRSRKHATAEVTIKGGADGDPCTSPSTIVAKHFENEERGLLRHEQAVHSHAASAGIPVPQILHVLDNFLVLEKVEGRTLMDVVNDEGVQLERKKVAIAGLGTWLSSFHAAFAAHPKVRRRGDANLRNFIIMETGAIVGFDFEESGRDDPIVDLYEVVDSILQSHPGILSDVIPAIEWKFDLCLYLFRGYALAACKPPREIIVDSARFLEDQVQVMENLAAIRETSGTLITLIPAIKRELGIVITRFLSNIG